MQKISFSREMGFTRAEFDRLLPAAFNDRPFSVTDNAVSCHVEGGTMHLRISEQKFRNIASISLPYLEIDFWFENLEQQQVDTTMRYFDLRYQRGGG